jgi:hypothetical protein
VQQTIEKLKLEQENPNNCYFSFASMEKVTQKARENISIEEQIATIHKTKGLV